MRIAIEAFGGVFLGFVLLGGVVMLVQMREELCDLNERLRNHGSYPTDREKQITSRERT